MEHVITVAELPKKKKGRKPKANLQKHRHSVRLNNKQILHMEKSEIQRYVEKRIRETGIGTPTLEELNAFLHKPLFYSVYSAHPDA